MLVPCRQRVSVCNALSDKKRGANARSDGNIRYYEYENDKFEYLSEYSSPNPQRGVAFMPKRGINLHENEVLRCFKTVNDSFIEPVSFIVPRRAEMFQSDIYPPTNGLKPGVTVGEWFGGKTAMPPKISLESIYDGEAPKEVPSDYKPPQAASAQPSPVKAEAPRAEAEPTPTLVQSRGPPPQLKDNKDSLSSQADRFAEKDVDSDKESESSFEEVSKPIQRPSVTAAKQEEKARASTFAKEPEQPKFTPAPVSAPAQTKPVTPPAESTPAPASASTSSSAPSTGGPATILRDALGDIKSQLEYQNKVMADQSDQIALLLREVTQLKAKASAQAQEPSAREKDERIRQLELELEEARS